MVENTYPPKEKMDRRIQRTRHLLREALISLIKEKNYEEITVQDITERANVNRSTFYLHFKDKDELLYKSMVEVYDALAETMLANKKEQTGGLNLDHLSDAADFQHVADHAEFYKVILSEKGVASFVVRVRKYLARVFTEHILEMGVGSAPRFPLEAVGHFLAGAEIGLISWWLENGKKQSPEEMARMMLDMCAFGTYWALGVPASPQEEAEKSEG